MESLEHKTEQWLKPACKKKLVNLFQLFPFANVLGTCAKRVANHKIWTIVIHTRNGLCRFIPVVIICRARPRHMLVALEIHEKHARKSKGTQSERKTFQIRPENIFFGFSFLLTNIAKLLMMGSEAFFRPILLSGVVKNFCSPKAVDKWLIAGFIYTSIKTCT